MSRYSIGENCAVEVCDVDALDLSASACVFSYRSPLRLEVERRAGRSFQTAAPPWANAASPPFHPVYVLEGRDLPWRVALSIRYRARHVDPQEPAVQHNHLSHSFRIESDLFHLFFRLYWHLNADRIVVLPLSWRNPTVVCSTTVKAALRVAALRANQPRPPVTFTLTSLSGASHFLPWLDRFATSSPTTQPDRSTQVKGSPNPPLQPTAPPGSGRNSW